MTALSSDQAMRLLSNHQVRLLRALKRGDGEEARAIMRDHMLEAERYMLANADIRASAALSGE